MIYICKQCGFVRLDGERPCPSCGSTDCTAENDPALEETLRHESEAAYLANAVQQRRSRLDASGAWAVFSQRAGSGNGVSDSFSSFAQGGSAAGNPAPSENVPPHRDAPAQEPERPKKRKKKNTTAAVSGPVPEPPPARPVFVPEYAAKPLTDRPDVTAAAFSLRVLPPLENETLLRSRLHFEKQSCEYRRTDAYYADGKLVGYVPMIRIEKIWDIARDGADGETQAAVSKSVWNKARDKFLVLLNEKGGASVPPLLQDILDLGELDLRELCLEQAGGVMALLKACVLADIRENNAVMSRWRTIKHYPFKVELDVEHGGIFSVSDADKLRSVGIRYLNDIRKYSIYDLKNLFLDHALKNLPEELNAAFKEDFECRKDRWYQIFPFVFAFPALLADTIIVYIYRYTILKNATGTAIIFGCLALWVAMLALLIHGAVRARRRRVKRKSYRYFTGKVKVAFVFFILFSLFTIGSDTLFYERYDNYNDEVYYRYMSDGSIAVAGVFDEELTRLYVPSELEGKPVAKIAAYSFAGNKTLESVGVPASVKTIGKGAFRKMKQLESVTLPASVGTLSDGTFYGCEALEDVRLAEGLETVGDKAFYNCKSLLSIELPSSVRAIGKSAFAGSGLESIELVDVDTIGDKAFKDCTALETVLLDGVESLGKKSFSGCTALADVTLRSTRVLGSKAFKDCTALATLSLDGVETIGKKSFAGCEKLESVTLRSIRSLGDGAFEGCTSLTRLDMSGVEDTSGFGKGIFKNCTSLFDVRLPQTACAIPIETFAGCSALEEIDLSHATAIGDRAFKGCSLVEVRITGTTETIGKESFKDNLPLESVSVASSVRSIGKHAFETKGRIPRVTIPFLGKDAEHTDRGFAYVFGKTEIGNLTVTEANTIGKSLKGAKNYLYGIRYLNDVVYIPKNAFKNFKHLVSVEIPGIVTVGDKAFKGCSDLGTISLPGAETIGKQSFSGCTSLKSVTLPSIRALGDKAFFGCTALGSLDLSRVEDASGFGKGIFKNCTSLFDVRLPMSDCAIPKEMFAGCASLEEIDLSHATAIGDRAFKGCSLVEVRITGTTETIGKESFKNNLPLETVSVPSSVRSIGKHAFETERIPYATLPFLGKDAEHTDRGFAYVFGKTEIGNLTVTEANTIGKSLKGAKNYLYGIRYLNDVVYIPKNAFKNFKHLVSVEIPGIVTVGDKAFKGCSDLETISLAAVETIGKQSFAGCASLADVMLRSNRSLGDRAFENCRSIERADLSGADTSGFGKGVFKGCTSLFDVRLPQTDCAIPKAMFENCTALEEIDLSHATAIGDRAFKGCSLIEVTITDTTETIGKESFKNNLTLKQVSVPSSVRSIGKHAFETGDTISTASLAFLGKDEAHTDRGFAHVFGKTKVIDLTVTEATSIGKSMRGGKHYLCGIRYVNPVGSVPNGAFKNFERLMSVEIPGVETIGDKAFYNCKRLLRIELPSSVRTIGKSAFAGSGLERISIAGVTTIGDKAFKDCTDLETISLAGVEKIGNKSFSGCSSLADVTLSSIRSLGNKAFEGCMSIRRLDLSGADTGKFGPGVFKGCEKLSEVILPQTDCAIPKELFAGCSALTQIDLSHVTVIGDRAFEGCSLSEVTITDTTKTVGKKSFKDNRSLKVLSVSSAVETIGKRAFDTDGTIERAFLPFLGKTENKTSGGYRYLFGYTPVRALAVTDCHKIGNSFRGGRQFIEQLSIEGDATKVNAFAFSGFAQLQYVSLPDSIETIGMRAFYKCDRLKDISLDLPKLEKIGSQAFYGCDSLDALRFGDSVKDIGHAAFRKCTGLNTIRFGAGLERIRKSAFRQCTALTQIDFNPDLERIDWLAFDGCSALETVVLPDSLQRIGWHILSGCDSLTDLTVPYIGKTVSKNKRISYFVGNSGFLSYPHLQYVKTTAARSIAKKAFGGQYSLVTVRFNAGVESLGADLFSGCYNLETVYVPYGCAGTENIPDSVDVQFFTESYASPGAAAAGAINPPTDGAVGGKRSAA